MDNIERDNTIPVIRQSTILDIIREEKSVSVSDLASRLFINEATIRRDLNKLERNGLLSRTYGGAILTGGPDSEIPLRIRESVNSSQKSHVASLAADQIDDGDFIFVDSSSSVEFLVPFLNQKKDLKIITNGARLALILANSGNVTIYSTGGRIREHSLSYAGQIASDSLHNFNFNKAFFSCRGVDIQKGLSDISEDEATLRKIVIQKAGCSYLLADNSKLGCVSFCHITPLSDIQYIITDMCPPQEWLDYAKQSDLRILY